MDLLDLLEQLQGASPQQLDAMASSAAMHGPVPQLPDFETIPAPERSLYQAPPPIIPTTPAPAPAPNAPASVGTPVTAKPVTAPTSDSVGGTPGALPDMPQEFQMPNIEFSKNGTITSQPKPDVFDVNPFTASRTQAMPALQAAMRAAEMFSPVPEMSNKSWENFKAAGSGNGGGSAPGATQTGGQPGHATAPCAQGDGLQGGADGDNACGGYDHGGENAGPGSSAEAAEGYGVSEPAFALGGLVTPQHVPQVNPPGQDDGSIKVDVGEYVLSAAAVQALGPDGLKQLDAFNKQAVQAAATPNAQAPQAPVNFGALVGGQNGQ